MRTLARLIIADGVARGDLPDGLDVDGLAGAIPALLDGLLLQRAEQGEAFDAVDARRQVDAVVAAILRP